MDLHRESKVRIKPLTACKVKTSIFLNLVQINENKFKNFAGIELSGVPEDSFQLPRNFTKIPRNSYGIPFDPKIFFMTALIDSHYRFFKHTKFLKIWCHIFAHFHWSLSAISAV